VVQELNDTQLLQLIVDGNESAFSEVYQRYHQAVYLNICKLTRNTEEAEDILQEVFIALWKYKNKLSIDVSIGGWLFTTSYYKCLEQIRINVKKSTIHLRDTYIDLLSDDTNILDNEEEFAKQLKALNAAIEHLPSQKKLAFKLNRLEGKTYDEVATALDISVESAKDYVKSASKIIKRYIANHQLSTSTISGLYFLHFIQN
jgi:RNA polymerase sigma factor (sigma-70 family)